MGHRLRGTPEGVQTVSRVRNKDIAHFKEVVSPRLIEEYDKRFYVLSVGHGICTNTEPGRLSDGVWHAVGNTILSDRYLWFQYCSDLEKSYIVAVGTDIGGPTSTWGYVSLQGPARIVDRYCFDNIPEMVSFANKAVDDLAVLKPTWMKRYRITTNSSYELRIFCKELRLFGYDVIPGYSVIHAKVGTGLYRTLGLRGNAINLTVDLYAAFGYTETRFSSLWHLRVLNIGGVPYRHYSFLYLEELVDFLQE